MKILVFYWIIILLNMFTETKQLHNKNIYKFSTKNQQQHHSPSMNAILMECPITNANKKGNSILFQQNQNNDDVKNCNQNILVNIRLLPPKRNDKIDTYEKYILLDEIYDTEKKTKAKLMSPYLIEIIREEPVLMCPLEFIKSVEYQPFCKTNEMMAPPVYAKEIVAEATAKDTDYNRQHSKQFRNQITFDDNPLTTKENRDRRKIPYSSRRSSLIELDPNILSDDNFELLHIQNEAYNKENAREITENLNENYANDFKLLDDEEDVIQKDILQYIKLNLNENIIDNGANLINEKNSNTVRKTTNNSKNNNNLYITKQEKPINFIKHSTEILPNDKQASNKNVNDIIINNSVEHKNVNSIKQSNKNEYYNNNEFEKLQDDEDDGDDDKETYYNFLLNTKEQISKNAKLSHNNNNNVSIKQKQNNNSPAKNFEIMENFKKNNNINNNNIKENYIKPIRLYDDKPTTLENLNALHGSQKFIPSTYNVMPISSNVTYPYESGGKPCDKHLPWNAFNNAKMQSTISDVSITGSSTSSGSNNNNNNNDNPIDIVPATNEQYNGIYFPSQFNSNSHTTDDDNTKKMVGEYFNAPINNKFNSNKNNNNNRQLKNAKNIKFKSNQNYYPSHPIQFSVRANKFNDDKNINENLPQTISSHIKNSNIKNVNSNNNNDNNMKNNNKVVHQSENALNSKETELSKNNNFFIKEIYYDENPFSSSSSSGGSNNNNNNNNGVLKGHFQDDNINEMNDDDVAVVVKSEDEFHKNNNNNNNKNYNNNKRNNLTNGKNKMNSVSVTGTTLSLPSSTNSLYNINQNRVNGHPKDVDMMMMVQPPGVYYNDNLDSKINTYNDEYYIDEENYNNNNQIENNNNQPNIISSNKKLVHPIDNNNSNNNRIYRDENPQINDHNYINNNNNNNKNNNNDGLNTNQLSMENGMKQENDEFSIINQKLNGFDNNEKNIMNSNKYNNNNNKNNNVDEENKMKNFNQNLNAIENVRKIPSNIETTKNSPENIKKLQNDIHQLHEKERDNDYENNLIIARNYLQSQQQLYNQINIHDYENKKHKNNNDDSAANDDVDDDDYLLLNNDATDNDNNLQNDQIQYEEILKDKNLNTYDKMQLIEMVEPNKKSKLIKLKNSLSMMAMEPLNNDVNDDGNDNADKHIGKRSKYEYDNYNDAGDYDDNRHIENEYYNDFSQLTNIDKSMRNNLKYNNKMNEKHFNNNKNVDANIRNVPNKNRKSKLSNSKHKMKMISQDNNQRKNSIDAIWYSVYGISAPLQYLTSKIRIFRKHGNSWHKIAPSISLTSLSNNYVNKNLTISFSYHMNTIMNPSSSITTKQYYQHQNNNNCKFPLVDPNRNKLLIPNNTKLLYSKNIITIDTEILPLNIIINNEYNKNLCDKICNEKYNQIENNNNGGVGAGSRSVNQKRENNDGICILSDSDYLPIKFNVMEKCRNNPDKLCLNMFNENSPVYRFSIKIPFIQNMLLYENVGRARITQIIVDGTVYGVLFITIQIMNVGYKLNEFSILIAKCPELCSTGKYMKIRNILPYQTISVNFDLHLELQESYGKREHNCEVQVQDKNNNNNKIIASRQFLIKPMARCFCLWNCLCNCISAVASTDIGKKSCRTMSLKDAQNAGFGKHQINAQKNVTFNWNALFFIISILICFVIVLGLLKAIIGCCVKSIGNWKYNHLQPYNTYDKASICKRFFINTIFFLVFPCVVLCKCFNPTDEDLLESHENVTWARSIIQKQINSDTYDTDDDYDNDNVADDDEEDDDNDERKKFIKVTKNNNKFKSNKRLRAGAGGNINSNNSRNTNEEISENSFESYRNVEEEERDTSYVLAALTESRDSLKMLDGHYSEDSQLQNTDEKFIEATTLVKRLLAVRMVYRTLNKPMGRVNVPENQLYSIRGYFIPAAGSGYQFITHIPLRQYWYIDSMNHSLKPIIPPLMLLSRDFIKNYANTQDVLNSGDLSEMPSMNTPCITVLVQDITLYNLNEDE